MSKERRENRIEAATEIAEKLLAAETAIDAAIAATTDLNACLPANQAKLSLSATFGQDAIESAAGAFASLIAARKKTVEAHHHLNAMKDEIGLREFAFGGLMKRVREGVHLHVVNG
jgi:hypothetical protein